MTGVLVPLRASNVMSVTTFRKDGTGVATPVGLQWDVDGRAYFWTREIRPGERG